MHRLLTRLLTTGLALSVALGLFLAPAARSAAPTPTQLSKYRHEVMESMGHHMAAMGMIMKGESDRKGDRLMHAAAIRDIAATVPALFPAGSGPSPTVKTDAKAEIWTQREKFDALAKTLQLESGKLVEAIQKDDAAAIGAAFGAVGGSCGDCHDLFKVED